ncbi:hypothetical protein PSTT_10570, partial [Puccinia striiformis]
MRRRGGGRGVGRRKSNSFLDGILTIPGFKQIKKDPDYVYRLPENITRPIVRQLDKEDHEETIEKQPRHSKASIILNSFGPFIGRSKPCKRKIRQRNREDKVVKFLQKSARPKIVFTLMQ